MAASPICEVKDGAGAFVETTYGNDVTPGNTITGRLASQSGVDTWDIRCLTSDELSDPAAITAALVVDQVNKTFTYTAPVAGRTYRFQSQINGGVDKNGRRRDDYTTTFCVYTPVNGVRCIAADETTEGDPDFGYISSVNQGIRSGGGGGSFTTANGAVAQEAAELAALVDTDTDTVGTTFSLAANRTYIVDVEVMAELDGPTKCAIFNERRIFRTVAGVVTANAQESIMGPTDSPVGGGLSADVVVAITYTGTTGRVDVTNNAGADLRVGCIRQIRYLETNATAAFDLATYAPSFWIEGDDLTQGGGTVSAFNNKGSTGVDPTVSAEQPTYNAANVNYNNLPTWKCVAGGAAASYIQAAAAAHGLTTGPYTVVIVGQCKDANYALGTPSGNTAIAGGGGTGNKWQAVSDAATYLASTAGVTDNPSVMAMVFDGASSDLYVNSLTPTSGSAGVPAEDLSASNVIIGNYGGPTIALGQDGDTALVAFFPADKTADLPAILNGLGAKFGITIAP